MQNAHFTRFAQNVAIAELPKKFTLIEHDMPHYLCVLAANELKKYLSEQQDWQHNFGLSDSSMPIVGKMFGVLVVQTKENEVGYLAAFSGKLAGGNHHAKFVPPVFDMLTDGSFLNEGMKELTLKNQEIKNLQAEKPSDTALLDFLIEKRKNHSFALQQKLFESYAFLNQEGVYKNLSAIFKDANRKTPPSGTGECATPKLLQYAFLHQMKPLAIAEFWWGQSPKGNKRKHGHFYPCCEEKCEPILGYMLKNIECEYL